MSHVSVCIFQTFQWEFGKQHSFGCQLGPGSARVPRSVSIGLCPGPPFRSALLPGIPTPSPSGPAHAVDGCGEGPPGVALQSRLCCHFTVMALHLRPFQGGPMGPAATLANPSALKNLHQHQGAWAPRTSSLLWQLPLCVIPSHFCTPISRGPVAEGENPLTPSEKLCRAKTSP